MISSHASDCICNAGKVIKELIYETKSVIDKIKTISIQHLLPSTSCLYTELLVTEVIANPQVVLRNTSSFILQPMQWGCSIKVITMAFLLRYWDQTWVCFRTERPCLLLEKSHRELVIQQKKTQKDEGKILDVGYGKGNKNNQRNLVHVPCLSEMIKCT